MEKQTLWSRTALLTTGVGPLPAAVFSVLQEFSDLQGVVYSQKARRVSRLGRIRAYGAWATGQITTTAVLNTLFNCRVRSSELQKKEIDFCFWQRRKDETAVRNWLQTRQVEAVFVCSFQHILRPSFFAEFPYCLNVHPAWLPDYRGPEPILWELLEGEQQPGVTLHKVDAGIDTGDIICQTRIKRPGLPLAWLMERRLAQAFSPLLQETLRQIAGGTVSSRPQTGGFYRPAATLENRR